MLSLVPFYWSSISGQQPIPSLYDLTTEMRNTLKDLVEDNHDIWAATSICNSHWVHDQRRESPTTEYDGTLNTRNNLRIQGPFMLIIQFNMFCLLVTVMARLHCIKFDTVLFTSRCIIPLDKCCNRCIISKLDQHLSVLGPCLMALDQHLRMLSKVSSGVYDSCNLILTGGVVVVTPHLRLQLFRFCVRYGMSCSTIHLSI